MATHDDMTTHDEQSSDHTTERSRWIALYVLCVGVLMIVLDVTVVNVALPSIQEELHFSTSSLAWVVNAYLIAFGGLLLLAGRFGDLLGRSRIFLLGVGLFTLASLCCGLAWTQTLLVAARFVQGIAGAMTSAVVLGMIVTMFPSPRDQAKAIGVYAFVASAGGSVGLLAGGVLTQALDWHWIFFVNVPIGIATILFARRLLDKDEGIGFGEGADIPGAVLITSALMLSVYTIVSPAAEDGWGAGTTLALGALSLVLLAAFVAREATASNPLVPLRIFRSRNVSGANLIQVFSVAGMFGMFFMGALYMRKVLGYDALEIGLAFLPVTITMGSMSIRFSEPLITRFGARSAAASGLGHDRGGTRVARHHPHPRELRDWPVALDAAARHRRGRVLPGADGRRDVRRHTQRCRACLWARQHDRPGRRRAGARGAGHALDIAHEQAARPGTVPGGGADRRLSARVLDRYGSCAGRYRRGHGRIAPAAGERRPTRERRRACRGRDGVLRGRIAMLYSGLIQAG